MIKRGEAEDLTATEEENEQEEEAEQKEKPGSWAQQTTISREPF